MKRKLNKTSLVVLIVLSLIVAIIYFVFSAGFLDKRKACGEYYMSFTGSSYLKPHPPFDCTPYSKEFPRF